MAVPLGRSPVQMHAMQRLDREKTPTSWIQQGILVKRRFTWIEWNLQKITAHGLDAEEVEAAFDRVFHLRRRPDDSFQMYAETPSGRRIWVIWRYDRQESRTADIFADLDEEAIFVITAY